ncbi:MAG: hypothetical protein AAF333_15500 [Planctomycetota bacterium]
MAPGFFQCAFCGKSFRWKPEIAGRAAKCKCGKKIHIPETDPGEDAAGGGASALGAALDSLASPTAPVPAARQPFCRACRRPMKPDAVICLECGVNQQTGEALAAEVETLSADERKKADWESGVAGLKFVRAGLWCNLVGLLLYLAVVIGTIVLAQRGASVGAAAQVAIALAALLAIGCLWVSPFFCLMVPKDSGARGLLWAAIGCFTFNVCLVFAGAVIELPPLAGLAGLFSSLVGTLLLLMFLLRLAEYLEYGQVIEDAEKLIRAFIGLIFCGFALLLPCFQCLALVPFVVLLLYVTIAYALLILSLARTISVSLREDFG